MTIIALVSLRLGTDRRARIARLRAAASATARGYFTPLNVSGTEAFVVALPLRPGTVSRCPGCSSERVEMPLAFAIAATDVRWRIAIAPSVSPARTV